MSRESMMGSSKYEFEVEEFEKDFVNKMEIANIFRENLVSVLYTDYIYRGQKLDWSRV